MTRGYRESAESWAESLRALGRRGMRAPVLAVGDGGAGLLEAWLMTNSTRPAPFG